MERDIKEHIKKVRQNTVNIIVTGKIATEGVEEFIRDLKELDNPVILHEEDELDMTIIETNSKSTSWVEKMMKGDSIADKAYYKKYALGEWTGKPTEMFEGGEVIDYDDLVSKLDEDISNIISKF